MMERRYVHVGRTIQYLIPYKVWVNHASHIRHKDTLHVGGPYNSFSYKMRGHCQTPIPDKVWRKHKSFSHHIIYVGGPYINVGDHMITIPYKLWESLHM